MPEPDSQVYVDDRGFFWRCCQSFAGILVRVFYNLQVRGKENVPRSGGVLVVSNHQSYLDPVMLAVMLDRSFTYLAEAYLFKFKPLAMLIRALHAFPIERGKSDVGAMKEMISRLHAGDILNAYPEGTRTRNGQLQPAKGGVALAIRRAKVPVLPAIIVGAYEAWPRRHKLPGPGVIRVIYGKPVRLDHLKGEQIIAEIDRMFQELFAEATRWRDESVARG